MSDEVETIDTEADASTELSYVLPLLKGGVSCALEKKDDRMTVMTKALYLCSATDVLTDAQKACYEAAEDGHKATQIVEVSTDDLAALLGVTI